MASRWWVVALCVSLVACDGRGDGEVTPDVLMEEVEVPPTRPPSFTGLSAPVKIHFDSLGVPHIYAQNDFDLFYGAGYQQARDRLFELTVLMRKSVGTWAEVAGEDGVSVDTQSRVIGFRALAQRSLTRMKAERPQEHALFLAFVEGMNRHVREVLSGQVSAPPGFAELGFEPAMFEPVELMAIGNRILFGFSETLEFDLLNTVVGLQGINVPVFEPGSKSFIMSVPQIQRFVPPVEDATSTPHLDLTAEDRRGLRQMFRALSQWRENLNVGHGSNAWTIRGDRTFNGRPMLANDSHAGLAEPNNMYMWHLNSSDAGGTFNVAGLSFPGIPGVHLGHNDTLAWGATTNFADLTDLWGVEVGVPEEGSELPPDQPVLKLWGGERDVPILTRTETIAVKGGEDVTIEVQELEGVGVILPQALIPVPKALLGVRNELLLGWRGFDGTLELGMFLDFDRAKTTAAFDEAVLQQLDGNQTWHFITAKDMGLRSYGEISIRGAEAIPNQINVVREIPKEGGEDGEMRQVDVTWTGEILRVDQTPSRDGSAPYLISANNDPWGHTADNDPTNDDFYYGSFFSPGVRAGTLDRRLQAQTDAGGVTVEQTQELQLDVTSPMAERMVPLLAAAFAKVETDAALEAFRGRTRLAHTVRRLEAWDKRMTADSRDALVLRVWTAYLSRAALSDDLTLLFDAIDEAQPVTMQKFLLLAMEANTEDLLEGDRDRLMLQALVDALDLIDARSLTQWQQLHFARFKSATDELSFLPRDGDDFSINVQQARCWEGSEIGERCFSTAGAVFRVVTTIGDDGVPETVFNWPRGNTSQTQDWVDGVYRRMWFRTPEVQADTVNTLELRPE